MTIPIAVMLAMQASGMVMDYFGKQSQIDLAREGAELQESAINQAIQTSRVQSADESLQAMIKLRKTLGSQIANFAAKGIMPGTVTQALVTNESIGNFKADERMRKINQLNYEAQLKAGLRASKMHEKNLESDVMNQFMTSIVNKLPTSPEAYESLFDKFKTESGYGLTKVKGS